MKLNLQDRADALLAATVVVLRGKQPGFEILLLQRNSNSKHMAGNWMFPGGKVDVCENGTDEFEKARNAAARELCEEAGIQVAPSALIDFSHWLTPVGMTRRFATWFYLAELPYDCQVEVDGSEMVAHRWLDPRDACELHDSGELILPPPTLVSLFDLSMVGSVSEAFFYARSRLVPYFFPKIVTRVDEQIFLYPGDSGYAALDPDQPGPRHRAVSAKGRFNYQRTFTWPCR